MTKKTGNKNYIYQFSTKPFENETGIIYYNYRNYDPILGRWVNRDAILSNDYLFCFNSPTVFFDHLGNVSKTIDPNTIPGKPTSYKPPSNCLGYACKTGDVATRQPKPNNPDLEPKKETDDEMMKRLANCKPVECDDECKSPFWLVALWVDEKGNAFHAAGRGENGNWGSQTGVGGNVWVVPDKDIDNHVEGYKEFLGNQGKLTKKCYCCCQNK